MEHLINLHYDDPFLLRLSHFSFLQVDSPLLAWVVYFQVKMLMIKLRLVQALYSCILPLYIMDHQECLEWSVNWMSSFGKHNLVFYIMGFMTEHFCGGMYWSIDLLGFDAMWSYWWKCWYLLIKLRSVKIQKINIWTWACGFVTWDLWVKRVFLIFHEPSFTVTYSMLTTSTSNLHSFSCLFICWDNTEF